MQDYFAVVLPDRPSLVRIVRVEFGSAEIECTRTGARIEFEIHFETPEKFDEFISVKGTDSDVRRYGGRILVCPPPGTSKSSTSEFDQLSEKGRPVYPLTIARLFGITVEEFQSARYTAFSAIVEQYHK